MKFAPRVVERSETMQTQILHALANGPVRMDELRTVLGIEQTDAGRQAVKYQLGALIRKRKVRRIGSRASSAWALIGHRGTVPAPVKAARIVRHTAAVQKPPSESWWLVADEEFADALRKRATITGWEVALMGTPDRE